ncbi:MAG TPA: hypothetical protein VFS37_13180 [Conexibacter sp.]|nr:hypothetical protein [Conexibacter sp.]
MLAVPASAWFETAAYDVPDDGVAACLRAAGPGHVSLLHGGSRTATAVDLLSVAPGSVAFGSPTELGEPSVCGAAAGADGAVPLLAGWERIGGAGWPDQALRVASPGAAPATVRTVRHHITTEPELAVSPAGAAVMAWSERRFPSGQHALLYAAVRPAAGAAFGPPTRLGRLGGFAQSLAVGIDAAGRATVAWLQLRRSHGRLFQHLTLKVATTTPDGRFGSVQRFPGSFPSGVALAVLPDGHALLASDAPGVVQAYERPPGQTRFAPVGGRALGAASHGLAVALAPDGGAAIAFRNDERSVFTTLRPPGGKFGRWATVVPHARSAGGSLSVFGASSSVPDDPGGRELRAALGPRGEVVLSWVDDARRRLSATAYAAHGTLARGMERPRRLGSPCRSAAAAAPVVLADGALAVAWADNARATSITESTVPRAGGRVHVARGGSPDEAGQTPSRVPPRVSLRLAGPRALEPGGQLLVRVGCAEACDVRVLARARSRPGADRGFDRSDDGGEAIWVAASTTLRAGGSAVLRPPRFFGFNPAGVRGRPHTPIEVLVCAPAGPMLERLYLSPPRIADPPPLPRVVGLTAVRRGGRIRVSWRTTVPASRARFLVSTTPGYRTVWRDVRGRGHSRFAVVLHPGSRPVRRVEVDLLSPVLSFPLSFSAPVA